MFTTWNWFNAIPWFIYNGMLEGLGWVDDSHNEHFLFLITPDELDESDVESWEGSIKRMSRLSSQHMEEIKETLNFKIDSLSEYIEQNSKRDVAQDRDLRRIIHQRFRTVEQKVKESSDKVESLDSEIKNLDSKLNTVIGLLSSDKAAEVE